MKLNPEQQKKAIVIGAILFGLGFSIILSVVLKREPQNPQALEWQSNIVEPSVAEQSSIYVQITGYVNKPGVYELKKPLLLIEAIKFAGGLAQEADYDYVHSQLNLATKVSDGQKIYIPEKGKEINQTKSSGLININTASENQLMELPGIGEATAQKIIAARPFVTINDLMNVSGVGESKFNQIKDLISI